MSVLPAFAYRHHIACICAYLRWALLRYLSRLNLLKFALLTNREILLGSHGGRYSLLLWWPLWYCRNERSPVSPHCGTSRESSRERQPPFSFWGLGRHPHFRWAGGFLEAWEKHKEDRDRAGQKEPSAAEPFSPRATEPAGETNMQTLVHQRGQM